MREKMLEVTKQIQADKYGIKTELEKSAWNEIELSN